MIDKVNIGGKVIDTKKYIEWLKNTPIIKLDKRIKEDNKIIKSLENIIKNSKKLEFIDDTENVPNVKVLTKRLIALNQIINDYYLLLITNTDEKTIKEIFKKYRFNGEKILDNKEIEQIMKHSKKFVYIINNIENLYKIFQKVLEQIESDPGLLNGALKSPPLIIKIDTNINKKPEESNEIEVIDETDKTKSKEGGASQIKKAVNTAKDIDNKITKGVNTINAGVDKVNKSIDSLKNFNPTNWNEYVKKQAERFDNALINREVVIKPWEWMFFGLDALERRHPILSYPFDLVNSVLQGTDNILEVVSKIIGFLGGFSGDGIWSILSAIVSVIGIIPVVGSVSSVVDIIINILDPFIGTLSGGLSDTLGELIDATAGFLSFIFNLSRKNWGLAIYSFFDILEMFGIDAVDTWDGILTNINNINRYLFTINERFSEILELTDAGDVIIDSVKKYIEVVQPILNSFPYKQMREVFVDYIKNSTAVVGDTIVLTGDLMKLFPPYYIMIKAIENNN